MYKTQLYHIMKSRFQRVQSKRKLERIVSGTRFIAKTEPCDKINHATTGEWVYGNIKTSYFNPQHILREWYKSGSLWVECDYVNHMRQGKYRSYYPNGKLWIDCTYVLNKRDGVYKSYFPNGKKSCEGYYRGGKKQGMYYMWNDKGDLIRHEEWAEGKCVTIYVDKLRNNPKTFYQ